MVVLHVTWAGRTLWAHDASPTSIRHGVPIMDPGATVGPVGTRVPMDLSFAGPVRWVDEIPLSSRRGMPRETAGRSPHGALSTEESEDFLHELRKWRDEPREEEVDEEGVQP